jgi:predicted dehydrogenase
MEPVRTALVGVGGMGATHRHILHEAEEFALLATVERYVQRQAAAVEETRGWGVPVYEDYWEMLEAHGEELELVVIAAPHHWHAPYALVALDFGLHVLVEKPVTVTAQQGYALLEAQSRAERLVGVHFQWTATGATQELKQLLRAGGLGQLREVVAVMKWWRGEDYYRRNEWAGRRYVEGLPCWDGVLLNQAIHLINSALQLATGRPGFAEPVRVQAELYRVHEIETEDLACLRVEVEEGVVVMVYATTCHQGEESVGVEIVGTEGRAWWKPQEARVVVGEGRELALPQAPHEENLHRNLARCVRGLESELYAPAGEAVKGTLVANAAYLSVGRIDKLSWEQVGEVGELIDEAAARRALFSELPSAPAWARRGEVVEVGEVYSFDGLGDDGAQAS